MAGVVLVVVEVVPVGAVVVLPAVVVVAPAVVVGPEPVVVAGPVPIAAGGTGGIVRAREIRIRRVVAAAAWVRIGPDWGALSNVIAIKPSAL